MNRRDLLKYGLSAGTVAITDPVMAQTKFIDLKEFVRLRLCNNKTFVRRDIYTLTKADPDHPIIKAYRTGVAAMKALPVSNANSWIYQANIHGTTLPVNQWPAGAPFSTCDHGPLYFLSWHRMYLFFFEKTVRKHSGNPDFALPYWNYTKSGQAPLPQPFRSPANASNALYDSTRAASVNAGNALSAGTVNDATALAKANFLGAGQFQGSVQNTPHNSVHSTIGGNMGSFNTAGHDPIFWLHHCNIDRLWEKWLAAGGSHANPIADAAWMAETAQFADENGNIVTMVNSDILDTISQLKYRYEDPRGCIPLLVVNWRLEDLIRRVSIRTTKRIPLLTDWKVDLKAAQAGLKMPITERSKDLSALLAPDELKRAAATSRIVVKFRGLRLKAPMNGYFEAYLTVGSRKTIASAKPMFIGNISTFGADAESQESMMQSPKMRENPDHEMGVTTEIDITDLLQSELKGSRADDNTLDIELRPVTGVEGDDNKGLNREAEPVFAEVAIEVLPIEGK